MSREDVMSIKILIITNELYPNLNANSEIAYRIARHLKANFDCDITMLGYVRANDDTVPIDPNGLDSIIIHSLSKYVSLHQSYHSPFGRITHYMRYLDCFCFFLRHKFHDIYDECAEYKKELQKQLKSGKYDCVVAFSWPYASLQALIRVRMDIPFVAYKLDPWSNNCNISHKKIHLADEKKADQDAAAIITTDLIYCDYPYNIDEMISKKIHILNFPNIIDYGTLNNNIFKDSCHIHCLFAGKFYPSIREPHYTFNLFEKLYEKNIIFHVFGQFYGEYYPEEELPNNVFYHGSVSSEEIIAYMQSADVLVNIGNTIPNMMPSKLLTYISLGKPILNIIKIDKCPTLSYMEKYPLGLSVLETEEPTYEDIKKVGDFILTQKGRRIPFDTIKELYYDCTPEYVCGKVYDIISEVVNDE